MALVLALLAPALLAVVVFRPPAPSTDVESLYIGTALLKVPPAKDGAPEEWRGEALPYRCPALTDPEGCHATFRIPYAGDAAGDRLLSLYIPSFQGNVTVSLNGVFLATSGWSRSVAEVTANMPMLIPLPRPLLRSGANAFEITLTERGARSGFLDKVALGPDELLRPDYDRRLFLFSTLQRLVDGWQIAMGLAMLILWAARPRETIFLLFSAVLLAHASGSLPAILGDSVDETLLRVANNTRFLAGSLMLPLAWLFLGKRPPVPIAVFLLIPVGILASRLLLPGDTHQWLLGAVFAPVTLALLLFATAEVARAAFLHRNATAMLLFGACLTAMVYAVHDALVQRDLLEANRMLVGRFAAPFVMATVTALLIWRFAQTMNALDQFSARLKREVAAAEDALRRSFAREQAQARTAILEAERVRLMSDLHDGIAGQLVSILAQCELRGDAESDVADAVRAALTDLRLVVASLEDSGDDLGVMLALFRERIEPQLAAHGVRLLWRMASLPDVKGLHPGATLTIFRILQEATINAARHSGSPAVTIEASASPLPDRGVRLSVRDQGRGGVVSRPGSYGLGNMRRRAESLNGDLTIESGPDGTTVTLDLPARLP